MKIDTHHHFWRYTEAEYGWIDDDMSVIRRDFLPEDLRLVLTSSGIDAAISVQARQTEEESSWLLQLASWNPFLVGVVGWLPLSDPQVEARLDRLSSNPKLRGLRHVLQGEPEGFMLSEEFNRGLSLLKPRNLAYDILVYERQLPEALQLVDRHPGQRFVLDHIAKPRIREGLLQPWLNNLRELARRDQVWCKLSGLVTEADYKSWKKEDLLPFIEGAFEAFGPGRLLFGSDWPVCSVACSYARWHELVSDYVSRLSPDEQACFWHRNATEAYQLPPLSPSP